MSEENQTSKNQDNHSNPTSTEDAPEIPEESPSDQVRTLYIILLTVSGILILLAGILKLDYLLGVFLGCSVVGLNFHWTVVFVRNLIQDKKVQPLNLIFYLTKFAISALVLFGAINYFEIPPLGLIIGLSNILLAVVAYSVINSMKRAPVQEPEENKE
ncbi:MAG: ATP synthase subunit I [SAR324 cluster bacterium]|nr:ATP synthase subunit I [SAR324 cluster bacterium]